MRRKKRERRERGKKKEENNNIEKLRGSDDVRLQKTPVITSTRCVFKYLIYFLKNNVILKNYFRGIPVFFFFVILGTHSWTMGWRERSDIRFAVLRLLLSAWYLYCFFVMAFFNAWYIFFVNRRYYIPVTESSVIGINFGNWEFLS